MYPPKLKLSATPCLPCSGEALSRQPPYPRGPALALYRPSSILGIHTEGKFREHLPEEYITPELQASLCEM